MKRTITVDLDQPAADQLDRAARYRHQSPSAFLAQASEEVARRVLLDEAVRRYQEDPDDSSLSELAAEHALAVEELMQAIWARDQATATETGQTVEEVVRARHHPAPERVEAVFLENCRTAARAMDDPGFLQEAQEAVTASRALRQRSSSSGQ